MKKICVLGLGYIGLPTAAMFAAHGFQVVGVDINDRVVETLNNGGVHIQEPGLKTLVQAALKSGNLRIARQPEQADAFIIAVPTPLSVGHSPQSTGESAADGQRPVASLTYVVAAAEAIVPHLRSGNLVVLESTVPPRTTVDVLLPLLERSGLGVSREVSKQGDSNPQRPKNGAAEKLSDSEATDVAGRIIPAPLQPGSSVLYVAHCPERVLPGRILEELVGNDRVIGGVCRTSAEMAKVLYASFVEGEILLTGVTTAEMVKLMENTYRDVNIALANELALAAEQVGINVWEAIELANRHPRVQILKPGPGVGGHCIAVDPWFIVQAVPEITPLIQTARRVNKAMPTYVVALVKRALAELSPAPPPLNATNSQPVIACLGLAYKADVDDTRESPAIEVIKLLQAAGFEVRAYDSHVQPGTVPEQVDSLQAAVNGAAVIVVLTDHSEFRQLRPEALENFVGTVVIDTRNILPTEIWEATGKVVWKLGRLDTTPQIKTPVS